MDSQKALSLCKEALGEVIYRGGRGHRSGCGFYREMARFIMAAVAVMAASIAVVEAAMLDQSGRGGCELYLGGMGGCREDVRCKQKR